MQLVKHVSNHSWLIFDKIFWFPGTADSLMQKSPQDRMSVLATYLAEQITVRNKFFKEAFSKNKEKSSVNFI